MVVTHYICVDSLKSMKYEFLSSLILAVKEKKDLEHFYYRIRIYLCIFTFIKKVEKKSYRPVKIYFAYKKF